MSECVVTTGTEKRLEAPCAMVVRGHEAVLKWREQLVELSQRCDQSGAMDHLEYYLGRRAFARKRPTLVLNVCKGVNRPDRLESAVLLYEQLVFGVASGLYSADYHGGIRTVIAPAELRARTAFAAGARLVQEGALLVHVSYEGEQCPTQVDGDRSAGRWRTVRWAGIPRPISGYLPLESSFDATLANMGKHTRRNLRYYRRRAEAELGVEFVPRVEMSLEDFLEANQSSLNLVPDEVATDRYRSMGRLKRPLFCGVRDSSGRWLSLIGGRRHEGTTEIVWQINRSGLPRYSISTVMRAYLLEHEIAEGTARLAFEGGTLHSIKHAFVTSSVIDILMHPKAVRTWAVRQLAKRTFPERSFLRDALTNPDLVWSDW